MPLDPIAKTGVTGLDDILNGGLTRGHSFLLEGEPGSGKTTIALQFLLAGARAGERSLYVTLSETEKELREGIASHGWTLDEHVTIYELAPAEALLDAEQQQSLLYSSDLELGETTKSILAAVERVKPTRIVLDSLSEIRLLAQNPLRYRRQVLALKHYFARQGATLLLLDDLTAERMDTTIHSLAHAVIRLEQLSPEFGAERRRMRVLKYRGQKYRGGFHDFVIETGGVRVFPRLVSLEHKTAFERRTIKSDLPDLDLMLGGGIEAGSSTVILGPSGTGKTLLAVHFLAAAVARGERAALFVFDEELGLLSRRLKPLGVDLEALAAKGQMHVEQVDAAELSPGEFAHRVRSVVDERNIKTVLIDSLNGYQAAMPAENQLVLHVHELLQYLNRQGAATFVTVAQVGLVGDMRSPFDITYLADTVVLLRYFEVEGQIRRAISVLKKRTGTHQAAIREFEITQQGIRIGAGLTDFHGVLRGSPELLRADLRSPP